MAIWVFPGQGTQRAHMAANLGEVPALLRAAGTELGADLRHLCVSDPAPDWDPVLVQPALFVVGLAAARAALRESHRPEAVVGHSFGEFAALTALGALSFGAGLGLVTARARAMARCADGRSGMLAVLGLDEPVVRAICAEHAVEVSNVNSPEQTVLAGELGALVEAGAHCRSAGAYRTRRLGIPYAAHTAMMAPAAEELRPLLAKAGIRPPRAPLYSCITGEVTDDPARIRELLVLGMTRTVDFAGAVRAAGAAGARVFLELGPGSPPRLLGLIRDTLAPAELTLGMVSTDAEARVPAPFQPRTRAERVVRHG